MTDGYYLSTSSPLFTLGKPKRKPRNLRRNPRESARF